MGILLKAIYTFNAMPIKISRSFFAEIKFLWKNKVPQDQNQSRAKLAIQNILKVTLPSHSNKNSMIMAQKQT
jgi:hypothetical protein